MVTFYQLKIFSLISAFVSSLLIWVSLGLAKQFLGVDLRTNAVLLALAFSVLNIQLWGNLLRIALPAEAEGADSSKIFFFITLSLKLFLYAVLIVIFFRCNSTELISFGLALSCHLLLLASMLAIWATYNRSIE